MVLEVTILVYEKCEHWTTLFAMHYW